MEAGLRSRKRKHQSSISDVIFTRSKSQIYVHRHRSGYARPDSVRTSNPLMSLKASMKSQAKQEQWGYTVDSEISVKDLRARRVFSPTTIIDEGLSVGEVNLKEGIDVYKKIDGNPNVSSHEGDLGVSGSVAIDPKPSSENVMDTVLVSENNGMEADAEGDSIHGDFVKMTPIVSESDLNRGDGEKNDIIDTQGSMSRSQSSGTSMRSKKKVFINRHSYSSYRRLLPYLTELGTDDSPSFEIVEATLPKVQKSSNMVPKMGAFKDQEIDAVRDNNKSGLSDVIQKRHEEALNDTLEECVQTTPPDSDIYSKPNLDKSPELPVKTTDVGTVRNCSNESNDSVSTSKLVLKSCSRMKMLQTPTSFSHRRLLPFLMSVSGDDSGALKGNQLLKPENTSEQNQQPTTPSLIHPSIILDESKSTADVKSDSPTSTLTPVETSFDGRIPVTLVSSDNLLDTDGLDSNCSESNSQLEVKLQAESDCSMNLEQESPIKDLKCVEETTSNLEIVPSADTNDNQKPVNETTHESLIQIAPFSSPLINRDSSRNGILKRTPRGCRGICNCLNCTSFRLNAERSFEFSRNQMHDAEEVALELINDLNSLRNILERSASDANDTVKDKEVKEACAKALHKEEVARARLAQMNEDLSFHCRSMTMLRPKVTFANKIEAKVISDKKVGER